MLIFFILADSVGSHNTCDAVVGLRSSRFANSNCTGVRSIDQRVSVVHREKAKRNSMVDRLL